MSCSDHAARRLTNAQAFAGYEKRARERCKQANKLEQIANGRPVRQGKSWNDREDKRLLAMRKKHMSHAAMADKLGRSMAAVRMRLQALEK